MTLPSYATIDQVLALFETPPSKASRIARLTDLLTTATQQVIEECGGRDYLPHPASGTAVWIADGNGSDILHIHEGLISLALLELSFDGGRTYVPVDAADYMLLGDSPYSQEPLPAGEPFFHLRFTTWGHYTTVPPTVRAARLTGVRGWPAVPVTLSEATAQRVRQLAFADGSYSGSLAGGSDEFGAPAPTDRFWPQSLYNFLAFQRERFMGCHFGGGQR